MSFFGVSALGGNPFSTPIGQKIEQATDGNLPSESWELNMEICDMINNSDDGARDAVKAIRKRLQQNAGKNYTIVLYTLTVLETCVKNCDRKFHVLVCSKDFVQELVKLIGPKNDPPTAVQEKVLSLIQSWADAFAGQPDLSGVCSIVTELRAKGIEFPATDLDTMAPIHTPQRSVTDPCTEVVPPSVPVVIAAPISPTTNRVGAVLTASLTPDQLAKLHSELDVVHANMSVFSEMLSELTPGKEDQTDIDLLKELNSTCRAMQQRLVELIEKLANDEITADLLRINDELNNMFLRYTRFEKNREVGGNNVAQGPSSVLAGVLGIPQPQSTLNNKVEDDSLIDLSDGAGVEKQMSLLNLGAGNATSQLSQISSVQAQKGAAAASNSDTDEFDMFAQSRNATYETSKTSGSTYNDNLNPDQVAGTLSSVANARTQQLPTLGREQDFDEMAAWLEHTASKEKNPEESLTSSEFERFLAERAAAADVLPPSTTTTDSSRNQKKKDTDESGLFAL